jgi:hypothetical protein
MLPYLQITSFFLWGATAAFSILLGRSLMISQWMPLESLVVATSLLGMTAGSAVASLLKARGNTGREQSPTLWAAVLAQLSFSTEILLFILVLAYLPLDCTRMLLQPGQIIYIIVFIMVSAFPFSATGGLATFYLNRAHAAKTITMPALAGIVSGTVLCWYGIPAWGEERLLQIVALVPLIPLPMVFLKPFATPLRKPIFLLILLFLSILSGFYSIVSKPFVIPPASTKAERNDLRPVRSTQYGMHGRITHLSGPRNRIVFASGSTATGRHQTWDTLYRDGNHPLHLQDSPSGRTQAYAQGTLAWAAYRLVPHPQSVFLVSREGGNAIACALSAGCDRIDLTTRHPGIASRLTSRYPDLSVMVADPRFFLAHAHKRYDIIHLEIPGAAIPGADAMRSDHMSTVEAITRCFRQLAPKGVLLISRRLHMPPSDSLRTWATFQQGLHNCGIEKPGLHMALLRNRRAYVILASAAPLLKPQPLITFAADNDFQLVYPADTAAPATRRDPSLPKPLYQLAIQRLAAAHTVEEQRAFFDTYPLDIRPTTDDRPYPSSFLKWLRINEISRITSSNVYSLLVAGEIILPIILLATLMAGMLLLSLFFPFFQQGTRAMPLGAMFFMCCIGTGAGLTATFFLEMSVGLLGSPAAALAAAYTVLSGAYLAGAGLDRDITLFRSTMSLAILGLLLLTYGLLAPLSIPGCLTLGYPVRLSLLLVLAVPAGWLSGRALAFGIKGLCRRQEERAVTRTSAGCTAAIASLAGVMVALDWGISSVAIAAGIAHAAGGGYLRYHSGRS